MNPEFEKLCNSNAIIFTVSNDRAVFCEYFIDDDDGQADANKARRVRLDLSLDPLGTVSVYSRYIAIPHPMPANWEGAV